MMDYVAGNHPDSFELAAELHVSLSRQGADISDIWSMIGGVLLEDPTLVKARPAPRTRLPKQPGKPRISASEILMRTERTLRWRRGLSGVHYAPASVPGTKFMKLEAGKSAPMHGHHGLEATVVLSGRFSDGHGTYSRGDLVLGEPGMRHKPAAVGEVSCVCFVAHRPNRFWSRIMT